MQVSDPLGDEVNDHYNSNIVIISFIQIILCAFNKQTKLFNFNDITDIVKTKHQKDQGARMYMSSSDPL